jgi:hypothetical protein
MGRKRKRGSRDFLKLKYNLDHLFNLMADIYINRHFTCLLKVVDETNNLGVKQKLPK